MVLLTSGQVSIAVSSVVIFLFTFSIFISGYVVQQRTVHALREAIKPRPRAQQSIIYLPEKFRDDGDGPPSDPLAPLPLAHMNGAQDGAGRQVVEIIITEDGRRVTTSPVGDGTTGFKGRQQILGSTSEGKNREKKEKEYSDKDLTPEQRASESSRLSRARRRQKIKEEIAELTKAENPGGYQRRMW